MIDTFERFAPKICANCGNKFPWFEKRQKAEEERKQMKLESEEKRIEENQSAVKKIEIKIEGHGNVLNLGSMTDNVISNTIKLTQIGDKEIAVALESLTKAISSTTELTDNEKQKYLEQLNTLSEEALKPEDKRLPKSVLQTIINYGLGTLGAAGNLAEVWNAWGATIKTFFLRL